MSEELLGNTETIEALREREGKSLDAIVVPFEDVATRERVSAGARVMRTLADKSFEGLEIRYKSALLSFLSRKGEVDTVDFKGYVQRNMGDDFDEESFTKACEDIALLVTGARDSNIITVEKDDEKAQKTVETAIKALTLLADKDSLPREIVYRSALLSTLYEDGEVDFRNHHVAIEGAEGKDFIPQRFREACREVALFVLDTMCVDDDAKMILKDDLAQKESYRDTHDLEFAAPEQLGPNGHFNRNVILHIITLLKPLVKIGNVNISVMEDYLKGDSGFQYTAFMAAVNEVKKMIKKAETQEEAEEAA